MGIKVYTIGVGTTGRAPFWGRDVFGRKAIRYANVSLDEELLKQIAAATGGRYFNVRDPGGLEDAMASIDELEKTEVERDIYSRHHEWFGWFLLPGLGLIGLAVLLNLSLTGRIA